LQLELHQIRNCVINYANSYKTLDKLVDSCEKNDRTLDEMQKH